MPGGKLPRIETELVILRVAHNLGTVQDDMISPANPAFDPHVPTTPFDLAR